MSRDDFTRVVELPNGSFNVIYGIGDDEGEVVATTGTLRQAVIAAIQEDAEYGVLFRLIERGKRYTSSTST